jgi:dynein heavy chain
VFITSNPSYAGRVSLPDNLKALFRPIAMMVPDSALIAEILLFASGFASSKKLSKKLDIVYKLAQQQLSAQDHYDFGLRALLSSVKVAEMKKRQDMSAADETVLYCAIRDSCLPKLTREDTPLLMGILNDLLPGIETNMAEGENLRPALLEEIKAQNMLPVDAFVSKCLQLDETRRMRHGTILVGKSGSGKTTSWKLLQASITRANNQQAVKVFPLNPKSCSIGELYGEFRPNSVEWMDGVFASLLRSISAEENSALKWVVFDGPIDVMWIESMNTLLDDNKILTLNNGERIPLSSTTSLLFETDNLTSASVCLFY